MIFLWSDPSIHERFAGKTYNLKLAIAVAGAIPGAIGGAIATCIEGHALQSLA